MKIRWKPTEIGGETTKADFYAYVYGVGIGRVMKEDHSYQKGVWSWSFMCGHGEFAKSDRGTESTKQAAADKIRERLELFLATSPEDGGGMGYEPEEFPPDSSSEVLHRLKARDSEAFWKRIDDIRAGRVDRNYHRWKNDNSPLKPLTEEDF